MRLDDAKAHQFRRAAALWRAAVEVVASLGEKGAGAQLADDVSFASQRFGPSVGRAWAGPGTGDVVFGGELVLDPGEREWVFIRAARVAA